MNRPFLSRSGPLSTTALLVTSVLGSTACGEDIFNPEWVNASVQTVLIYSLTRPELNLPSGYDFVNRNPIEVQRPGATGFWDLLVDTRDGELLFFPPGALGIESEVMILALPDTTFDAVIEAPQDSTLYTKDQPLPIQPGTVFILRTHIGPSQFGVPCFFWGKLETTEVEPVLGTVVFIYDVSPLCDDRGLVPTG